MLAVNAVAAAQQLAFPGAAGAGRFAVGGRGGDVYVVTNLNDAGAGSLRNGITSAPSTGKRTIVFNVGGTIRLESNLDINKPFITIAGQTAPGGGITIADRMTRVVNTNNVVLRHVRFRVGDTHTRQVDSSYEPDALWVPGSSNVMIDHVSASWSVDETLSVTHGSNNVSVQWSNITESLRNAGHSKGNHGYGSLINGGAISYHHNLYAHHDSRNPRPQAWEGGTLNLDFRNNVIYDWGGQAGYNGDEVGQVNLNYVGNYLVAGPSTAASKLTNAFSVGTTPTLIYQDGNKIDGTRDGVLNGTGGSDGGWSMFSNETAANKQATPHNFAPVTTHTADEAHAHVLASGGATPWNRDAVDARLWGEVRSNGTSGSLIDSQDQVGGWPALAAGAAPADADNDAMPTWWETARDLNPASANHNVVAANGYTNLENYLNHLTLVAGWNNSAGGAWSSVSNWAGTKPGATDATAIFGPVISSARTVTLDAAATVGQILFDSAGSYTIGGTAALTLDVISGTAAVDVASGSHSITAPVVLMDKTTFTVAPAGGTLTLSSLTATGVNVTKAGAGTLTANHVRGNALSVKGGTLRIAANGTSADASRVSALTIDGGGRLDLTNNSLVVAGGTLGTWSGSYGGITGLIAAGRAGGNWTGSGIITSLSAAAGPAALRSLGVATAGATGRAGGTFGGIAVSASDVLVMYTFGGDANLDGRINGDDYHRIDSHVGTTAPGWYNGDFNYDGKVNGDDYFIIDANVWAQATAAATSDDATLAAVPEPAGAAAGLIGAAIAATRRRRGGTLWRSC
ncbi:MAG TPA: hypothetical protein VER17_01575 [Tepidisphaeraceae bacterium]|nr:hypothetical protein [Tepidisphaeraceae bacterium]